MRDSSLEGYEADLEFELSGRVLPAYVHQNVMDSVTAGAIEQAAGMAFLGRFGEAEQARRRGGYDGLGLLDSGPVAFDSEATRRNMRRALDNDDPID